MKESGTTEVDMQTREYTGDSAGRQAEVRQYASRNLVVQMIGAAALALVILGGSGAAADAMRDHDPHTECNERPDGSGCYHP